MAKIRSILLLGGFSFLLYSCQSKLKDGYNKLKDEYSIVTYTNDDYTRAIFGKYDTVKVYKPRDNTRNILYGSSAYKGYSKNIFIGGKYISVGDYRNSTTDGRYYTLGENNELAYVKYIVNGQSVYMHDLLKNDAVSKGEIVQIDSSNIKYLRPPHLLWESNGENKVGVKFSGSNYPVYLMRVHWQGDSIIIKDEPKINLFAETIESYVEVIKGEPEFIIEYLDKNQKAIKKYGWHPRRNQSTFYEVPISQEVKIF